jgi:hypothetical protein
MRLSWPRVCCVIPAERWNRGRAVRHPGRRKTPEDPYRRRPGRAGESLVKQLLGPSGDVRGLALTGPQPVWRPRLAVHGAKVPAHVIQHGRCFLVGEFLDQPEKLLALHAPTATARVAPVGPEPPELMQVQAGGPPCRVGLYGAEALVPPKQ